MSKFPSHSLSGTVVRKLDVFGLGFILIKYSMQQHTNWLFVKYKLVSKYESYPVLERKACEGTSTYSI